MAKRIAVLGGGISGLSAAWNLTRSTAPVEVAIYEASSSVGGWMKSTKKNGAVYELGPRSLRTAGASARIAMELVRCFVCNRLGNLHIANGPGTASTTITASLWVELRKDRQTSGTFPFRMVLLPFRRLDECSFRDLYQ